MWQFNVKWRNKGHLFSTHFFCESKSLFITAILFFFFHCRAKCWKFHCIFDYSLILVHTQITLHIHKTWISNTGLSSHEMHSALLPVLEHFLKSLRASLRFLKCLLFNFFSLFFFLLQIWSVAFSTIFPFCEILTGEKSHQHQHTCVSTHSFQQWECARVSRYIAETIHSNLMPRCPNFAFYSQRVCTNPLSPVSA